MSRAIRGVPPSAGPKSSRELFRFSVAQYHKMYALFGSERVELLEGYIVVKDPDPGLARPVPPLPLPSGYDRLTLYRFSVGQFQKMQRDGVFGSDRVELLDGYVVRRGPMNPPHAVSVGRVRRQVEARLPPGWCLRQQMDVALSESQPLPDAVVVGAEDDYITHHPDPTDIALIVEVADTTLDEDRTTKLRLYARDHIAIYWIVNIPERRLEIHTHPVAGKNPRYRDVQTLAETDSVTVAVGKAVVGPILVADLLPPVSQP